MAPTRPAKMNSGLGGQEGAHQVERARREDGDLRLERARGDRGCHGVGGIVEAVREVEHERGDDDQSHDDERYWVHAALRPFLVL